MSVASLFWAVAHALMVEKVEMKSEFVQVNSEIDPNDPEQKDLPTTSEAALAEM